MNERGLTLVEMMIAMVIGLVVLGLATGIAINETRTYALRTSNGV